MGFDDCVDRYLLSATVWVAVNPWDAEGVGVPSVTSHKALRSAVILENKKGSVNK